MVAAVNDNAQKREFDPYHKWLGIPPDEQPPTHYRLLGLQVFESDADAILSAVMRQSAHLKTYQLGQHAALTQKLLNEVSAAKACLMDPQRKAAYDARLRKELEARDRALRVRVLPTAKPSRPAAAPAPPPAPPADAIPAGRAEPLVDVGLANMIDDLQRSARPAGPQAKKHLPSSKRSAKPLPGRSSKSSRNQLLAVGGAVALAILVLCVAVFMMQSPDGTNAVGRESPKPKQVSSGGGEGSKPKSEPATPPPPHPTEIAATNPAPSPAPQSLTDRANAFKADARAKMNDAPTPADLREIVEKGMNLVEEADGGGEDARSSELAKEIAEIALIAARKCGDTELIGKVTLRAIDLYLNRP